MYLVQCCFMVKQYQGFRNCVRLSVWLLCKWNCPCLIPNHHVLIVFDKLSQICQLHTMVRSVEFTSAMYIKVMVLQCFKSSYDSLSDVENAAGKKGFLRSLFHNPIFFEEEQHRILSFCCYKLDICSFRLEIMVSWFHIQNYEYTFWETRKINWSFKTATQVRKR